MPLCRDLGLGSSESELRRRDSRERPAIVNHVRNVAQACKKRHPSKAKAESESCDVDDSAGLLAGSNPRVRMRHFVTVLMDASAY